MLKRRKYTHVCYEIGGKYFGSSALTLDEVNVDVDERVARFGAQPVVCDGRRAGSLDHSRAHLIRYLTLQLSSLERMLEVVRESHADVEVDDVSEVNSVELKRERG